MAISDLITIGNVEVLVVDADPTTGGGATAPIASLAVFNNSGVGQFYLKTGSADTAWSATRSGLIDLTSQVSGLLPIANGGTNANNATSARTNLLAAGSGANSDITSISGLTTALSVAQGGTGQTSFTDGQLLIGNTSTTGLTKATLTAGSSKLSITNGNGSISLDVNQTNLSLGSIGGSLNLATQVDGSILPIANGGTNSSTAAGALTNLGAVAKAGDTMSGLLVLSADPSAALGAATKQYVDNVAAGLDPKGSVRAVSTSNITLSGTQTVDGVALIAGDRVLVTGQTTAANNGIYVVAAGSWTRATDADVSAEVTAGMFAFVEEGTTNSDSGWVLTTNNPITLGTTSLTFTQFSGAGQIVAGNGITKTGNTLSVNESQLTLNNIGGTLGVAKGGTNLTATPTNGQLAIGNGTNYTLSTLTAGSTKLGITNGSGSITLDVNQANLDKNSLGGSALTVANGGTGQTSFTNGQLLIGNTTGNTLTPATLTAGLNTTITNGAGTITIASTDDAIVSVDTVSTTTATVTTLKTIATTTDTVMLIETKVLGKRTGGTAGTAGDSATYRRTFKVKNVAGAVSIVNVQSDYTSEDQTTWNVTFTTSGTNVLMQVTGATNNNVSWKSETKVQSL